MYIMFASTVGLRWSSWVCKASAFPALWDPGGAVGFARPHLQEKPRTAFQTCGCKYTIKRSLGAAKIPVQLEPSTLADQMVSVLMEPASLLGEMGVF